MNRTEQIRFFGYLAIGLAVVLAVSSLFSCSNWSNTQSLLDTSGLGIVREASSLIQPPEGQTFTSTSIQFSWSTPLPPAAQIFEIARDADFQSLVLQKDVATTEYSWQQSDNRAGQTIASGQYYWRLRPKTNATPSQGRMFNLILFGSTSGGEAIYVNNSSNKTLQNGSAAYPYKSISNAVALADALRDNDKSKSMRILIAQGTYNEEVSLIAGISLFGGYDSAATGTNGDAWARNVSTFATIVKGPNDITLSCGCDITGSYTATTIVDGLTIQGGDRGNSRGVVLVASSPTIRNNIITGGAGSASRIAVDGNIGEPVIRGNTIYGTQSTAGGYQVFAIRLENTNGVIEGNRLLTASAAGQISGCAWVPYIISLIDSAPAIRNNLMLGSSADCGVGVHMQNSAPRISNNTIYFPNTMGAVGTSQNPAGSPILENNIIGSSGTITCNSGSYGAVTNNNCFGGTISGGTGNTNISNAGNQLFVNLAGADANIHTFADNDWRLTTNAAICDVRGGGVNLAANFTADFTSTTRTTTLPGGCTPANAGAAGWSMGAYESD